MCIEFKNPNQLNEEWRDRGGVYIEGDNISIVWFFFNKGLEHESGFLIARLCIYSYLELLGFSALYIFWISNY
jgi:hypothetical protein